MILNYRFDLSYTLLPEIPFRPRSSHDKSRLGPDKKGA
jgi:hypothetical protein